MYTVYIWVFLLLFVSWLHNVTAALSCYMEVEVGFFSYVICMAFTMVISNGNGNHRLWQWNHLSCSFFNYWWQCVIFNPIKFIWVLIQKSCHGAGNPHSNLIWLYISFDHITSDIILSLLEANREYVVAISSANHIFDVRIWLIRDGCS